MLLTLTRQNRLRVVAAILLYVATGSSPALATEKPIWAKEAIVLDLSCSLYPNLIASPDNRSSVEVVCHKRKDNDPTYSLRIRSNSNDLYETPLDEGAHELLWAPNSSAFFVDGSTSGYAGFFVTVYQITSKEASRKETFTNAAQKDMVASFPPCKASNRDKDLCIQLTKAPDYNMSGVRWTADSSAIDVFAEIPCSSSYGGIMCQVFGYRLSVPDGLILKRFTAHQVGQQWRGSMAWDMHIPDPPKYGARK